MRMTPLLIGEAVLAVLLSICCIYTVSSGSYQRETGITWRAARNAMRLDEPQDALEPLEGFLKLNPGHPGVRLQLAGLYLRGGKTSKAVEHLETVAGDETSEVEGGPKARKMLRALAEVMLGMLDGKAGAEAFAKDPKKAEKKFSSAKAHFEAAIKLENPAGLELKPEKSGKAGKSGKSGKSGKAKAGAGMGKKRRYRYVAFADACAGLGLVALWQDDFQTAERRFRQALSGDSVLGSGVGAELYNGLGVALASEPSRAAEAAGMFNLARNYRKGWGLAQKNRDAVRRGMAGAREMSPKDRAVFLKEIVKTHRKPDYRTCNTLGCGYYRLGDSKAAIKYLAAAVKKDPARDLAQLNLLAVRWDLLQKAKVAFDEDYDRLFAEPEGDPVERFWTTPVGRHGRTKKPSSAALGTYKVKRAAYYSAQDAFLGSAAGVLQNVENLPPDLEAALTHTRLRLTAQVGARLSRSRDKRALARGVKMLEGYASLLEAAVKRFPGDYRFHRMQGIRRLESGNYAEALKALEASAKLNADQTDVKELKALFAPGPEVAFFRPLPAPLAAKKTVLARSTRPLVGAVFRVHNGPVQLSNENAVLKLDGKRVEASFWGSELLYRPEDALEDGLHTLEAEATDLLGRKASASMKLMVDSSLPEIYKSEPADGGGVATRRPRLVVYYRDKHSGIDPTSVRVELRSWRGASKYFQKFVVTGGRYTFSYKDAGRGIDIREGAPVGADKVVLVPHTRLGTGTYMMTVTVGDVRGLKTTKSFKFLVTK